MTVGVATIVCHESHVAGAACQRDLWAVTGKQVIAHGPTVYCGIAEGDNSRDALVLCLDQQTLHRNKYEAVDSETVVYIERDSGITRRAIAAEDGRLIFAQIDRVKA